MKKSNYLSLILIISSFLLSACNIAGSKSTQVENQTIKIGVVGENNEHWKPVIESLAKEDIHIELVKFSDYTLPNQALADGEIDLNAFQHYAYLQNELDDKGLDLTVIGDTLIAPLGLYSNKITAASQLSANDKIAIPSDATNGGRALKLLESTGIIAVSEDAGYLPETADIVQNSLNLQFLEVEAAQIPSLLPDVAAAVINGGHAVDYGFNPQTDSIYLESVTEGDDNPYINIIVARSADKDHEIYNKIVAEFHTDAVAKVIETTYQGAYIPAWQ